jgi:carbonic anhydrase
MKAPNKEIQDSISPAQALDLLKEGNERFVKNLRADRDLLIEASETSEGQYPFAVILSCIDSRTAAELIFDQGIGDLFSVRIAGNILNEDILGSMEFGCKAAGSKIIVVLGHSGCGAVKGACDHVEMGNLTALLSKIQPAVLEEKETKENRTSANKAFVERVTEINVRRVVKAIPERSSILKEMAENGQIRIIGGIHNLKTGVVTFFENEQD